MKALLGISIGIMLSVVIGLNNLQAQSKAPVRIYLEHFTSSEMRQLSVRVLAKTEKRYLPVAGVEIKLYISEISRINLLGTVVTTDKGTATYIFNQEQFELARSKNIVQYFAVINESGTLKGKEAEITIKTVNLDVQFMVEDSVKQIHVHVTETDSTGIAIPQEDVEIKFLVERPLSPLPVGDDYNTTDEKGNVSMDFPDDLPGDSEGYLEVLVRIIENEDYGTVQVSEVKQWGISTYFDDNTLKRSLWASSANAPILLIVFITTLIVAVWGIIFYIVYKIFHIRKLGMGKVV
jgi:hypothetical protein